MSNYARLLILLPLLILECQQHPRDILFYWQYFETTRHSPHMCELYTADDTEECRTSANSHAARSCGNHSALHRPASHHSLRESDAAGLRNGLCSPLCCYYTQEKPPQVRALHRSCHSRANAQASTVEYWPRLKMWSSRAGNKLWQTSEEVQSYDVGLISWLQISAQYAFSTISLLEQCVTRLWTSGAGLTNHSPGKQIV